MRSRIALLGVVLLLARFAPAAEEALDREALLALGRGDDSWQVPVLEGAFNRRLDQLRHFPAPLFPPDLEEELVAALLSLDRLDPSSAAARAKALLAVASCNCPSSFRARAVLAEAGDLAIYRQALASFFDNSERWSDVLARSEDSRLVDFHAAEPPDGSETEAGSERRFRTELERNLSRAVGREAIRALLLWASTASDPSSPRRVLEALPPGVAYESRVGAWLRLRGHEPADEPSSSSAPRFDGTETPLRIQRIVLSLPPRERYRATRWLVERDHPALAGLPMSGEDINRLYPYLVRSRRQSIRERARRARRRRGYALASYLFSPAPDEEEKRETLVAMRDARADAVAVSGTKAFDVMERLLGKEEAASFLREERSDPPFLDALAAVPLAEARSRLEDIGSPEAIERLLKRPNRALSFPVLDRLRRDGDPPAARAAAVALVALGAPGASAILHSELGASAVSGLDPRLLAAAVDGPTDPGLVEQVVVRVASELRASPAGFAVLYRFHQRDPGSFLTLLSSRNQALVDRAYFAMSLSGDPHRLPLLVDVAAGAVADASEASRDAAFAGLAESDLGEFATRLHRLAGNPDRRLRFRAAAALVPTTAEGWALRLLLGNLDVTSATERRIARSALSRLPEARARSLLREMVVDGTAGSFGVLAFLKVSDPAEIRVDRSLQEQLWVILAEEATAGNRVALLAASRLTLGEAIAVVCRRLTAAPASAW